MRGATASPALAAAPLRRGARLRASTARRNPGWHRDPVAQTRGRRIERSDDVPLREGKRGRSARREKRDERNGLFVAGCADDANSDRCVVREQDPLRLEQRVFERGDPWQKRRKRDDGDAETNDRPPWPWHDSSAVIVAPYRPRAARSDDALVGARVRSTRVRQRTGVSNSHGR